MGLLKKKKDEAAVRRSEDFEDFPHLLAVKPREKYVFCSDYFEMDDYFACVLAFFHHDLANDNFGYFWGINRIPSGLDHDVATVNFEQIRRMSKKWIDDHQSRSEGIAQMNANEQATGGGTASNRQKARKSQGDLETIASELNDGAAYLHVHNRILVKAPTLEKLDIAINEIAKLYIDRFGTLEAQPYVGDQRKELSTLFAQNEKKNGKGFYFTSAEFAGSYSLVTHGLEDAAGEYVGDMVGDVNNSAVIFDVNRYSHHVVIAMDQINHARDRAHVSDMWGSKLSQVALMNNCRVVHLILDGANLDMLGPKFENLTSHINMNVGDINMFEMFGPVEEELSIFASQMQKLILMAEQAYETTDSDRSIIRGSLEEVATQFYIDKRMWYENAALNREKLRVTGIPHEEVPKLQDFVMYLDIEYKKLVQAQAKDPDKIHAMAILQTTFRNLLSNNGDLFNTTTSDAVDFAREGSRVVYDFSKLLRRGRGVAMAQLVNAIGFAVDNLGYQDLVVVHGAEYIDESVRPYVMMQFERLFDKGGRVAYCYNHIDRMLDDRDFNKFDMADYLIFGNMTPNEVTEYQRLLGQDIPADLARLIADKSESLCYIRRGYDNVVFSQYLVLDYDEDDRYLGKKKRRRLA